jgi:hypothetical protein
MASKLLSNTNFDALKTNELARALHVARITVDTWVTNGCPRSSDKTFCLADVFQWRLGREKIDKNTGGSLQEKKLIADIEHKEAQTQKLLEKMIERDLHEAILASRAKDLSNNWARIVMKNAVYLAMKPVDELKILLMEFLCGGSEALTSDNINDLI